MFVLPSFVIFILMFIINCQQVSNGHWFDPGRKLPSDASLAQW